MGKGDHLAEFEIGVLATLAQLGGDSYGGEIRQELERRGRRLVTVGAVYATLRRLEGKGFVRFYIEGARPVQGGRSRKRAVLTASGRAALGRAATFFQRILAGIAPQRS